jgi:DNA-binding CsgD family transcriptional regulator
VGDLIEELGYLAVVDPEQAAVRLALFGNAAFSAGWLEAASRAARIVKAVPIQRPGYDRLPLVAQLISGIAAVLSEVGTGGTPETAREARPEREVATARIESEMVNARIGMSVPRNEAEQMLITLASQAHRRWVATRGVRIHQAAALTERELQVVRLMAQGHSSRDVARELFISTNTVKTHLSSILRKLRLSNRNQLEQWATERHLT